MKSKKKSGKGAPKAAEKNIREHEERPVSPPEGEAAAAEQSAEESAPSAATEAAVLTDRLLRLQADFENYRKRMLRERQETYRQANEDLMTELLPVMDHLDLALQAAADHDADQPIVEGFRLVGEQLRSALAKFGLEAVDAEGAEFDPNLHEAISHIQSAEVAADHVMAQTRRGYRLGSKLLRAAQVVVSSGSGEEPEPEPESPESEDETLERQAEPANQVKE